MVQLLHLASALLFASCASAFAPTTTVKSAAKPELVLGKVREGTRTVSAQSEHARLAKRNNNGGFVTVENGQFMLNGK